MSSHPWLVSSTQADVDHKDNARRATIHPPKRNSYSHPLECLFVQQIHVTVFSALETINYLKLNLLCVWMRESGDSQHTCATQPVWKPEEKSVEWVLSTTTWLLGVELLSSGLHEKYFLPSEPLHLPSHRNKFNGILGLVEEGSASTLQWKRHY